MKKLITMVVGVIIGVSIAHALMSFYFLSLDPHRWTEFGRFVALNLYLVFGTFFCAFTLGESK